MDLSKEAIESALKGPGSPSVAVDGMKVTLRYVDAAAHAPRCTADDEVLRMGLTGLSVASVEQNDRPFTQVEPGCALPPPALEVVYQLVTASAPVAPKRSK